MCRPYGVPMAPTIAGRSCNITCMVDSMSNSASSPQDLSPFGQWARFLGAAVEVDLSASAVSGANVLASSLLSLTLLGNAQHNCSCLLPTRSLVSRLDLRFLRQCRVRENDGRKLDHRTLEQMRLRAVDAIASGVHPEDVAASLGTVLAGRSPGRVPAVLYRSDIPYVCRVGEVRFSGGSGAMLVEPGRRNIRTGKKLGGRVRHGTGSRKGQAEGVRRSVIHSPHYRCCGEPDGVGRGHGVVRLDGTGSSMTGRGRSSSCSGWVESVFGWSRRLLGRRRYGVAVKAERPQAEPRTYGLEGGVVHAMLMEPGRRNIRTSEDWVVAFATVRSMEKDRPRVRLSVIHSPRHRRSGRPVRPVGGMVLCDRINQSPRLAASCREPDSATTTRPITAEDHAAPAAGAAVLSVGVRARMWPSRRP